MGNWWSSEKQETLTTNAGQSQSNVTIIDPVSIENVEIICMIGIICIIKIIEFVFFVYRQIGRNMKKKYQQRSIPK